MCLDAYISVKDDRYSKALCCIFAVSTDLSYLLTIGSKNTVSVAVSTRDKILPIHASLFQPKTNEIRYCLKNY